MKETTISHYYLIDLENVQLPGLCGLNLPGSDSAVVFFISNAIHTATVDVENDILKSDAHIETFYISITNKDALDFELAAYFGALLIRPEVKRVSIISKDGGYKALEDYARKVRKDVVVYIGKNILEAFVAGTNGLKIRTYGNGKRVDFKDILKDKLRYDTEKPIRERIEEIVNPDEIGKVTEILRSKTGREKYLEILKLLGRKKGLEVYRRVKDLEIGNTR